MSTRPEGGVVPDDLRVGLDFADVGLRFAILAFHGTRIETAALGRVRFGFRLAHLWDGDDANDADDRRGVVAQSLRSAVRGLPVTAILMALRPPALHAFVSRTDDPDGFRSDAELLGLVRPGEDAVLSCDPVPGGSDLGRFLVSVTKPAVVDSLSRLAAAIPDAEPRVVSAARAEAEVMQRSGISDGWLSILPLPSSSDVEYPESLDPALARLAGIDGAGTYPSARLVAYSVAIGAALLG